MVHEAALLGHGHSSGPTTRGDGSPPRRARERERERGNATTKRATAAERRAEEEEWAVGAAAAAAKRVQEARYLYNSVVRRRGDVAAGRSDGSVSVMRTTGTAAAAAVARTTGMPSSPAAATAATAVTAGLSFPEFVELLILCACWGSPPPPPLPPDAEHVVRACSALLRRLIGSGGGISGGGGGGAARGVARANGLAFRRAAFASQRLQEALEAMREQLALAHAAHAAHAPRVAGALPALRIGPFLRMVEAAGLLAEGKVDEGKVGEGKVGGVGAAQAVRAFVCSLTVDAAPEGEPALAAGDEFHEAVRAAWSKCPPWQCPSSAPAPPQEGEAWHCSLPQIPELASKVTDSAAFGHPGAAPHLRRAWPDARRHEEVGAEAEGGGGGGTGVGALGLGILRARTLGALLARRPDGRLLGGRGGPAYRAPPRHLQQAGHAPSRGHVVLGIFASRLRIIAVRKIHPLQLSPTPRFPAKIWSTRGPTSRGKQR